MWNKKKKKPHKSYHSWKYTLGILWPLLCAYVCSYIGACEINDKIIFN
jgi:hypothetical protein